ncbi:MAG: hypothetical protein SFU57_10985 [Gemmatimonadales bacterium]|jgi:hypothetical protein|nr:hypothetical protein [Gemmatimonadales bacterium]
MPEIDLPILPESPQAFLPVHKLALGAAVGIAAALLVFVLTVDGIYRDPATRLPVELLAQFFSGYTVTWQGAFVGAGWAGFTGFVMGWFIAFVRNFVLAVELVVVRSRANLAETRDFLDHI